jgi:N-acetyl-gamma-glutamyl-phosphate reductase
MSIRAGIVGISGFGGGEAMRLVASHPSFELIYAAGEGSAGSRLVDRFPGVPAKLADLVIEKWDPVTLPRLDVLFASLPTGTSAEALARVREDVKIVDIGGDHRYVEGWAYGLADVWPAQIEGQTRVANPGCFPAATLNALAPLLVNKLIEPGNIVIDAKTGISGAAGAVRTANSATLRATRTCCPMVCSSTPTCLRSSRRSSGSVAAARQGWCSRHTWCR